MSEGHHSRERLGLPRSEDLVEAAEIIQRDSGAVFVVARINRNENRVTLVKVGSRITLTKNLAELQTMLELENSPWRRQNSGEK